MAFTSTLNVLIGLYEKHFLILTYSLFFINDESYASHVLSNNMTFTFVL